MFLRGVAGGVAFCVVVYSVWPQGRRAVIYRQNRTSLAPPASSCKYGGVMGIVYKYTFDMIKLGSTFYPLV